ncbi:hypothetical protein D3C86_1786080 [compost metagenome]
MAKRFAESLAGILHHLHGVGHDEAADTGAADNQQFERLVEDFHVAAHGHVAAENTAESHKKPDDDVHFRYPSRSHFRLTGYGFFLA